VSRKRLPAWGSDALLDMITWARPLR